MKNVAAFVDLNLISSVSTLAIIAELLELLCF